MKMLFSTDSNGWPTRLVDSNYSGDVPANHTVFDSLVAMVQWQEENKHLAPPPTPEWTPVPDVISLRQFLSAADRLGLLQRLEALKTDPELPNQARRDIYFFLEYSNTIERRHPLIVGLADKVGVDDQQVDDLFRLADSL